MPEWQNEISVAAREARLLRFARNEGGDVVVKRQMPSLRGARSATKQSPPPGSTAAFWRNEPEDSFWRNEPEDSFWRNEPEVCGGQTASKMCRTIEKSGCYRPLNRVD